METYPKSVRQMGVPERGVRIYLEEYAYTYVHSLQAPEPDGVRVGVFYGRKLMQDGIPCYYVFGAIETEGAWNGEQIRFGQGVWNQIRQMREEYFPAMDVCGWFVRAKENYVPPLVNLQNIQDVFFAETGELLYLDTGEEVSFLVQRGRKLYSCGGFFIFFQRNIAMQEYLLREQSRIAEEQIRKRVQVEAAAPLRQSEKQPIVESKMTEPAAAWSKQEQDAERIPVWSKQNEEPILSRGWTPAQSAERKVRATEPQSEEHSEPPLSVWKRRAVAVGLLLALAAGILFYGHPERVAQVQSVFAELTGESAAETESSAAFP